MTQMPTCLAQSGMADVKPSTADRLDAGISGEQSRRVQSLRPAINGMASWIVAALWRVSGEQAYE